MADIEQLIHKRYQLQRMIAQGQACTVYLAFDQVLQRSVAVKIVPAAYIDSYRAAIRLTASFSHPNIVGTYDFVQEADMLYLVQEYVGGDTFGALLQTQLSPRDVADLGVQVCQALLYAGSNARGVCHGDLTPATIVRDQRGLVRVSDFALPSNKQYFNSWSMVGDDGNALSNPELPYGQISDGRCGDDTRALGLLLYQLLSGRATGATGVEPPLDGRLRFLRNVPVELCEIIARTVVRQHPQHINTPELLAEELRKQMDTLETTIEELSPGLVPQPKEMYKSHPLMPPGSPGTGKLVTALSASEIGQGGANFSPFQSESNGSPVAMETQTPPHTAYTPINANADFKLVTARPYSTHLENNARPARGISIPIQMSIIVLILLFLLVFALFFVAGYFIAHAILP